MPTRKTVAPRRTPTHNVRRRSIFPKRKIHRISLFALTVQISGVVDEFFYVSTAQFAVIQSFFVVSFHVKINRTVYFVSQSQLDEFLGQFDLFQNMSGRSGFNRWWK